MMFSSDPQTNPPGYLPLASTMYKSGYQPVYAPAVTTVVAPTPDTFFAWMNSRIGLKGGTRVVTCQDWLSEDANTLPLVGSQGDFLFPRGFEPGANRSRILLAYNFLRDSGLSPDLTSATNFARVVTEHCQQARFVIKTTVKSSGAVDAIVVTDPLVSFVAGAAIGALVVKFFKL